MGLFSTTEFNDMTDLLKDQLADLYDAEQRLTKAIPKMKDAATSPALKSAFEHHLKETKTQVSRLEQAFQQLGCEPKSETCDAMKGLISEGEHVIGAKGDAAVKDAALIAAAQRVEHYEIASYGSARAFARQLGRHDIAELLQRTLDEEGAADQKLTEIAEQSVNLQASHA